MQSAECRMSGKRKGQNRSSSRPAGRRGGRSFAAIESRHLRSSAASAVWSVPDAAVRFISAESSLRLLRLFAAKEETLWAAKKRKRRKRNLRFEFILLAWSAISGLKKTAPFLHHFRPVFGDLKTWIFESQPLATGRCNLSAVSIICVGLRLLRANKT